MLLPADTMREFARVQEKNQERSCETDLFGKDDREIESRKIHVQEQLIRFLHLPLSVSRQVQSSARYCCALYHTHCLDFLDLPESDNVQPIQAWHISLLIVLDELQQPPQFVLLMDIARRRVFISSIAFNKWVEVASLLASL